MTIHSTHIILICVLCGLCVNTLAQPHSVLITEIMADPAPAVGLPPYEWVEVHNPTSAAVDLSGFRLADAASSALFPARTLLPAGGYLILCGAAALPHLRPFGPALALPNFPSLANEGEAIALRSPEGRTLHAVGYHASWLGAKIEGGWSLELITMSQPCAGRSAWAPSRAPAGGTPGSPNSTLDATLRLPPPRLLRTLAPASQVVRLQFSSGVDSTGAGRTASYRLPGYAVTTARPLPPLFTEVELTLDRALEKRIIIPVSAEGIPDCSGAAGSGSAPTGLPGPPERGDIVINEILAAPRPGGGDYLELYHRGRWAVDLATLFLTLKTSGEGPALRLHEGPRALYPGDYLLLTEDTAALRRYFRIENVDALLPLSLPSLPEKGGTVQLLDGTGGLLEEVTYSSSWHYPVLPDPAGTALERIRPDGPSGAGSNWHSAASTAGGGTPGYRNSQYRPPDSSSSTDILLTVQPARIRPGLSGSDNLAHIRLEGGEGGAFLRLTLFNSEGAPVRTLEGSALTGSKNEWYWNGTDDSGHALPEDIYVIHAEAVWMNGRRKMLKKAVTLLSN